MLYFLFLIFFLCYCTCIYIYILYLFITFFFFNDNYIVLYQTLILPMPGRVAAQWFPSKELSTATCLGIFGNQFGVALGFLLTPIIVKNHENLDDIGNDLSRLCWTVAIVTTIGFILVLICELKSICKRDTLVHLL